MKKGTKIWLIIATLLIMAGCILFGCVMTELEWDFQSLSSWESIGGESL